MQSASDEIPFPLGWERKIDATTGRCYYIDHTHRVTQWDDPRLKHPSIWSDSRKQLLERLKPMFPDAPDEVIRQVLIKKKFVQVETTSELASLGYKQSGPVGVGQTRANVESTTIRSPSQKSEVSNFHGVDAADSSARRRSSPKPKPSAASPRNHTAEMEPDPRRAEVDPFTLMTLKARFPESTDDVLTDVLNQCGQNVDMASRELTSMGYVGRQKASERHVEQESKIGDIAKEEQRKQQREQSLKQLKREFDSFLDADIAEAFEKCSFDVFDTRSALRQREADVRAKALSATQVTVPVVVVREAPVEAATDIKSQWISSTEPTAVVKKDGATVVVVEPSSPTEAKPKPRKEVETERAMPKSAGATPSRDISTHGLLSLAKGPNPSLRHGSNPNLRSGVSRALGPDPSLRRGQNRAFRSGSRAVDTIAAM